MINLKKSEQKTFKNSLFTMTTGKSYNVIDRDLNWEVINDFGTPQIIGKTFFETVRKLED